MESAVETHRRLRLHDLLSVCRRLCQQACGIIRDVQSEREGTQGSHASLRAELKDPLDPRSYMTVADTRAQQHIVAGLRATFGETLDIVGEEEDQDGTDAATAVFCASDSPDIGSGYIVPLELQELEYHDVCVFIDPLDGTREFVEGRLEV